MCGGYLRKRCVLCPPQVNTFDITADMTRQYKAMQEELLGKINDLQNTINSLKDELGTPRCWVMRVLMDVTPVILCPRHPGVQRTRALPLRKCVGATNAS